MGDDTKVSVRAVGEVTLEFSSGSLVLKDCLYVPSFRKNLISVSKLADEGFKFIFTNKVFIRKNRKIICSGILLNKLYVLKPNSPTMHEMVVCNTSSNHNKRKEPSEMNQTYLWHLRLGHINLSRIQRLVANGPLSHLEVDNYQTCESCLEGKMTKRPFKAKGYRAKEVLELIHSDLYGPMSILARRWL